MSARSHWNMKNMNMNQLWTLAVKNLWSIRRVPKQAPCSRRDKKKIKRLSQPTEQAPPFYYNSARRMIHREKYISLMHPEPLQVLQLDRSMNISDENSDAAEDKNNRSPVTACAEELRARQRVSAKGGYDPLSGNGDVDARRRAELLQVVDKLGLSAFEFLETEAEAKAGNKLPAMDALEDDIALQREKKLATISMCFAKMDGADWERGGARTGEMGAGGGQRELASALRVVGAQGCPLFGTAGVLASMTRSKLESRNG